MGWPPITADEQSAWTAYIREICGIDLDATKGYLLETRLAGLLRVRHAAGFGDLLRLAKADSTRALQRQVIDAITTNETSFFRDAMTFELLKHKLIPDLVDRRSRAGSGRVPIRLWSAACSTGQEVYSAAMALKEVLGDTTRYDVRILGTDISDAAVARASYGCYARLEVDRGLPPDLLMRHFTRVGDRWMVRDELRALATFRTLNLLEPFAFPVPFDVVLCRNVAIYFAEEDRARLFRGIRRCLASDGCLVVGATESLAGLSAEFESKRHLKTVFYQVRRG